MMIAILFAIYFIAARLGLMLGAVSGFATLVWPPTGISLAALMIFGRGLWPGVALAAFVVNWSVGAPPLVALGMAAGNTFEAVLGVVLLQKFGVQNTLDRLRGVASFLVLGVFFCTLVSATLGTLSLLTGGIISSHAFFPTWSSWWLGDAMGNLVIAPFLLVWSTGFSFKKVPYSLIAKASALAVLVLSGSVMIFTDLLGSGGATLFPQAYFIFPILMLVAVCLEMRGVVTANLVVSIIAIWGTSTGHGKLWTGSLSGSLFQTQILLGVIAISKMVLAATTAERRRERDALQNAEKSQNYLIEATSLLSESIDYTTTLKHVAELIVPALADICVVHILGDNGKFQSIESTCFLAGKENLLSELVHRYLSDLDGPTAIATVIRTKKSKFIQNASDEIYRSISKEQRHADLLKELDLKSLIVSPLFFRNRILGAISIASLQTDRHYGPSDVALIEELARRAAIAIENSRLYHEAQEAILVRDEFISIASHELKTPLTSLKLRLQLLERSMKPDKVPSSPEKISHAIESSLYQVERLVHLVEDLLDVTKIQSGKLSLNFEEFDLCNLIREIVERFLEESKETGSTIELKSCTAVLGQWDRSRIDQVMVNLISNALKYAPGRPIVVSLTSRAQDVIITVEDFGPGIPKERQSQIFERFERATSSRNISGLGLGLFIVKTIVNAHQGSVRVESTEKQGATFTVVLPLLPHAKNASLS